MRRNSWRFNLSITLAATLLILSFSFKSYSATEYTITDLGLGVAKDINNNGQVVGSWQPPKPSYLKGFYWDSIRGRENIDLSGHGGFKSINDTGEAVLLNWLDPLNGRIWNSTNGEIKEIPIFPYAINNLGYVTGRVNLDACAGVWDEINGIREIPDGNFGNDINDFCQVVGRAPSDSFIWDSTNGFQIIPSLEEPSIHINEALGINNIGQVVGRSTIDTINGQDIHAFLWDSESGTQDLGTLGYRPIGSDSSAAWDINISGQVVGRSNAISSTDPSGWHGWNAFIWDETHGMQDLNLLIPPGTGWILGTAFAINDQGQIVGYGGLNGIEHAFLLTPVPAPTYTCSGFEPPCNYIITVKKNRCVPLKTELLDSEGLPITDADIMSPPILNYSYEPNMPSPSDTTSFDGLPPAVATDGYEFVFIGGRWCFNLKIKDFYSDNGPGTYQFQMKSGDEREYIIDSEYSTVTIVVEK